MLEQGNPNKAWTLANDLDWFINYINIPDSLGNFSVNVKPF